MCSEQELVQASERVCESIRLILAGGALKWRPARVKEFLETTSGFVAAYLPLNTLGAGPSSGLFNPPSLSTGAVARLTTLTYYFTELLLMGHPNLEVRYSMDDTVPSFDLALVIYEIKLLLQASLLFEGRTPASLSSFPGAFQDLAAVKAASPYLALHWHRPLATLLEPELRAVLEHILGLAAEHVDYHHRDFKGLVWELEASLGAHACVLQRQSEQEARRLLYTFRALYRGIRYATGFVLRPLGGDTSDDRCFQAFRRFWDNALATFAFSDVQQKLILERIHRHAVLPGEMSLYKWKHPAEVPTPAAIMVAGNERSDAYLEMINKWTDAAPWAIYQDPNATPGVRTIIFLGAVWIIGEFRTGVDLRRHLFFANPGPDRLVHTSCALFEVANRVVLFANQTCYTHPDIMWLVYRLFEEVAKGRCSAVSGKAVASLTKEWA